MVLTLFHKRLRTFHFNVHFKMKIHLHNPKWREPSLTDVSLWGSVSMSATLLWCAFHVFLHACLKAGSQDLGFDVMMSLISFTRPHLDKVKYCITLRLNI